MQNVDVDQAVRHVQSEVMRWMVGPGALAVLGASVVALGGAIQLPLDPVVSRQAAYVAGLLGVFASVLIRRRLASARHPAIASGDPQAALEQIARAHRLGAIAGQVPALIGFVYTLLVKPEWDPLIPLCGMSLVLVAMSLPFRSHIEELLGRDQGERSDQ